jgi:hypothetical protein
MDTSATKMWQEIHINDASKSKPEMDGTQEIPLSD